MFPQNISNQIENTKDCFCDDQCYMSLMCLSLCVDFDFFETDFWRWGWQVEGGGGGGDGGEGDGQF